MRLAGSMHLFPRGRKELPGWLVEAYRWCDTLIIEHDVTDPALQEQMQLPAGEFLAQHWPAGLCHEVDAVWGAPAAVAGLKPWAVAFGLQSILGGESGPGVELQLIPIARNTSSGKSLKFLETPTDFGACMGCLSDVTTAALARFFLDNRAHIAGHMYAIHDAWVNRDANTMVEVARQTGLGQFPEITHLVLEERSRAWLPDLVEASREGRRPLVLVGALHLTGTAGLPALLASAGHTVREL